MSVQVNENNTVRHDSIIYEAGQIIHTLEEDAKAELVRLGVVTDLNAAGEALEEAAAALEAPAAPVAAASTIPEPGVAGTVADHVAADVAAAEATAAAPGRPVGAVAGQPSAADVAAAAAQV